MELKQVMELLERFSASNLTQFQWNQGDFGISMGKGDAKRQAEEAPASFGPVFTGNHEAPASSAKEGDRKSGEENLTIVASPIVGTYYSAKAEGEEPFVTEGDSVKKGQVMAIVEAMKLMNEVTAPCDGVVEKLLAENEQMVEYGQTLFYIRPAQ